MSTRLPSTFFQLTRVVNIGHVTEIQGLKAVILFAGCIFFLSFIQVRVGSIVLPGIKGVIGVVFR